MLAFPVCTVEPQRSEHQTTELTEQRRDIVMGTGSSSTLGIFLAGVAQEFGLGKSTISDLQRDGKNIEKFTAGSADPSGLKKYLSGEIMITII